MISYLGQVLRFACGTAALLAKRHCRPMFCGTAAAALPPNYEIMWHCAALPPSFFTKITD